MDRVYAMWDVPVCVCVCVCVYVCVLLLKGMNGSCSVGPALTGRFVFMLVYACRHTMNIKNVLSDHKDPS